MKNQIKDDILYFNGKAYDLEFNISEKLAHLPKKKINEIYDLQENLKDLSEENFFKLLFRIVSKTFQYPFYIWIDEKGKYWTLDGHQRKRVLEKAFGNVEVPYIEVKAENKKEAKKEILAISSEFGVVTKEGFDEFTADFEVPDFDEVKFETTFGKWLDVGIDGGGDDDYEPPADIKTDIVPGDLFEIGCHRLLCGDSANADDVAKLMNGGKADLCVSDPPYGVSYEKKTNEILGNSRKSSKIKNDDIKRDELEILIKGAFGGIYESLSNCSSYYIFSPQGGELGLMMMMMMMMMKIPCRHCLIWKKNNAVFSMGRLDYDYKHEPILYGWKEKGSHKFYGKNETSILEFDRPNKSELHPTMKPVELVCHLIKNSSLEEQLVYDPFLGSGTTMVAAHQLKRKCFGMEIDEKYCEVIVQRMLKLDNTLIIKRNGIDETEKWLEKLIDNE